MPELLQKAASWGFYFVLPICSGCYGAWLSWTKGKNPFIWFFVNGIFPPTLMITIFQGPARPVPGHYRQCTKCQEYSKWRESVCRFCQTDLPA